MVFDEGTNGVCCTECVQILKHIPRIGDLIVQGMWRLYDDTNDLSLDILGSSSDDKDMTLEGHENLGAKIEYR